MCSVPMYSFFSASASRSDSSRTFLAGGVNGMCPVGVDVPAPTSALTCSRAISRVSPSDTMARAATPSPSWISPSRRCSVPM